MPKKHKTALAQIRRTAGLTQVQVAGQLGVSKATYSAWETGRAELGAERLCALSELFRCTPNDILGYTHSGRRFTAISEEDERVLDLFNAQPPSIREHFIGLMAYNAKGRRWR